MFSERLLGFAFEIDELWINTDEFWIKWWVSHQNDESGISNYEFCSGAWRDLAWRERWPCVRGAILLTFPLLLPCFSLIFPWISSFSLEVTLPGRTMARDGGDAPRQPRLERQFLVSTPRDLSPPPPPPPPPPHTYRASCQGWNTPVTQDLHFQ